MPCQVCKRAAPEVEFYDSIATYCKVHWRERVKNNRIANADYYKAFDRERANLPHRVKARAAYMKTQEGKASHDKAVGRWLNANPKKRRAHTIVNNSVKRGKMLPMPCLVCGKDAEAHHPDYDQPLDVIWLCDSHHKEVHALARRLT